MVTGFTLEKGYPFSSTMEPTNEYMVKTAKSIKSFELYEKCIALGLREDLPCGCKLTALCDKYESLPTEDGTCEFRDFEGHTYIEQASYSGSGDNHRLAREKICRAYGLLFLERAYADNMAVSFVIH